MTHPSYYDDPMVGSFDTTVTAVEEEGKAIILEETLFYPEGGGQPADIGSIAGASVIDVQKDKSGIIRHYLDARPEAPISPGSAVNGQVDWQHRWDFMQQHTGQHVLSAALAQVAAAATVSVHQGSELTTIEIDRETLRERLLEEMEERANEIIRADLPVRGFWIDDSELSNFNLRRPTSRTGAVRLVEIEGLDLVACGGVHLPRTGLLNLIHLTSVERIRGRMRLGFKIGDRALKDYREKDRILNTAAEHFSAHPSDVPERVSTMAADVQELHRTRRVQARRIAEHLYAGAEVIDGLVRTVQLSQEDAEIFAALADVASDKMGMPKSDDDADPADSVGTCILNLTAGGLHWAIAVGTSPFPQQQLRTGLLEPLGAKGGGKPPLWRGIIKEPKPATVDEFLRRFREVLQEV